ncbi:DUF2877 domain-containing protein [Egicoccus halophilus]|uniref:DUF2877 domain-containing protein n=1 Tax=Egicoccus halophilus TaxID=1670830 RepID=A0A8J3ESU7_9ACTN|nr:DUF2877 domain-containing protein [Egicoccus halophilus]GGI04242.1 hypothetical protein GCM10011354_08130 [Egicoccus halophilus]
MTGPARGSAAPAPSVLGAGASEAVHDLVTGPPTDVRVLACFPAATYLDVGGRVLAVATADGVHHPNALALAVATAARPFATLAAADVGRLGHGRLELPGLTVTVRRWWSPRPALAPVAAARLHTRAEELAALLAATAPALPPDTAARTDRLTAALAHDEPSAAADAVALLGLGPGLTPTGDDLLCGLFAAVDRLAPALTASGADTAALVARVRRAADTVVGRAPSATTAISAGLLHHARRGEVCAPAAAVLHGLTGTGPLPEAVGALLAVGATSGRDLGVGLLAGTRLVLAAAAGTTTTTPTTPAPFAARQEAR